MRSFLIFMRSFQRLFIVHSTILSFFKVFYNLSFEKPIKSYAKLLAFWELFPFLLTIQNTLTISFMRSSQLIMRSFSGFLSFIQYFKFLEKPLISCDKLLPILISYNFIRAFLWGLRIIISWEAFKLLWEAF